MKRWTSLFLILFAALHCVAADYPVQPVPFTSVRFSGGVLGDRQKVNTEVTLPFALNQCETSNRLKNFDLAAETMRRRASGDLKFQNQPATIYPFDDSDVYKVIEGASFCLNVKPDQATAAILDKFIVRIGSAQEPDGYLYSFRTMHPDSPVQNWIGQNRWMGDPGGSHELYNLGHLYEAATAHLQATGSRSLFDMSLKSAERVRADLGRGNPRIAPGHEVIEMGLAKLYRQTGDRRWLELAMVFLDNRGLGKEYSQDQKPVIAQTEAVGHAVRANYLYSGMTDIAAFTGDKAYLAAVSRIWENVVGRKLHLTGGCGARYEGEAYGNDYELPHHCYNETCAAVSFLFWSHRMFLMTGNAKYMDVFERSLYNGVLSGVSLSGDRFFYPNPLEYDGKEVNNHGFAGRAPWFGCSCCPPNILRTLASLGGYAYATRGDTLFVNLYARGEAAATVAGTPVKIEQSTSYPWDGAVTIRVKLKQAAKFTLALRIPEWVQGRPLPTDLYSYEDPSPAKWSIHVNGEPVNAEVREGFALVTRQWRADDTIALDLPMPVRRVIGNARIVATRGQVALERGPIVYAFEGVDNGDLSLLMLPLAASVQPERKDSLLGGVTILEIAGSQLEADGEKPVTLTAIPYSVWNNRGLSPMRVWLPCSASEMTPPPKPTLASQAKLSVSFNRTGMDPARINDQSMPLNATDGFAKNFDFWPHKGSAEWIEYAFKKPTEVRSVSVSWFDDTGSGECRLPSSWRVLYKSENGEWMPVKATGYPVRKTEPVKVSFSPVTTSAMRLEIQLPENFSAGLYECELEPVESGGPNH